jgi:hypothetical protein
LTTAYSGKGDRDDFIENFFDIQRWREDGKIDSFASSTVSSNIFDLPSVLAVHRSVEWIVENCPTTTKPVGLSAKSITNYVEDFLAKGKLASFFKLKKNSGATKCGDFMRFDTK